MDFVDFILCCIILYLVYFTVNEMEKRLRALQDDFITQKNILLKRIDRLETIIRDLD